MKKILICGVALLFLASASWCATQPQNIGYAGTDNPFQLWSRTAAQIKLLTPDTTSQIVGCGDCTQTPVCVSTFPTRGSWAGVSVSTGATNGFGLCQ